MIIISRRKYAFTNLRQCRCTNCDGFAELSKRLLHPPIGHWNIHPAHAVRKLFECFGRFWTPFLSRLASKDVTNGQRHRHMSQMKNDVHRRGTRIMYPRSLDLRNSKRWGGRLGMIRVEERHACCSHWVTKRIPPYSKDGSSLPILQADLKDLMWAWTRQHDRRQWIKEEQWPSHSLRFKISRHGCFGTCLKARCFQFDEFSGNITEVLTNIPFWPQEVSDKSHLRMALGEIGHVNVNDHNADRGDFL